MTVVLSTPWSIPWTNPVILKNLSKAVEMEFLNEDSLLAVIKLVSFLDSI